MTGDPPPKKKRKRPTSAETRIRIISALKTLMAERELEDITVREIAAEADVSAALIIRHFGSRDGVLEAIFDEAHEQLLRDVQVLASVQETPTRALVQSRLTAIVERFLTRDMEHADLTRAIMRYSWNWNEDREESYQQVFAEVFSEIVGLLRTAAPDLKPKRALTLTRMYYSSYFLVLREALRHKVEPAFIVDYMKEPIKVILDSIGLQKAT